MKPVCILPFAIVLAATCAIGQDTVMHRSPDAASLALSLYSMDRCPIGLEVNHGSFFLQRKVEYGPGSNDGVPLTGSVQRIHLSMTNPSPREIVKVQLTVHGYSDKWRAIPLVPASSAPDLAKKVTVAVDIKGKGHASNDLSLSSFTAVTSVDVDSLTYADGSAWQATSRGACRVAPSPMMLVSAER